MYSCLTWYVNIIQFYISWYLYNLVFIWYNYWSLEVWSILFSSQLNLFFITKGLWVNTPPWRNKYLKWYFFSTTTTNNNNNTVIMKTFGNVLHYNCLKDWINFILKHKTETRKLCNLHYFIVSLRPLKKICLPSILKAHSQQ